ncbi:porin [Pseudorhizobium halotolerans]|uniref:Porin n=1 Tax=Pseudorhizobium halotolerans TaxID=1233081 RepID=A0ABN7JEJ1_9HYPH|nr:porin [Pseudorhizobium halotolerans]CAD7027025.1 porin [Pseudorhizobium halotolerans]
MTIKSLLLGSAAALATVSGAQAADAIIAAEPEPMEYVRVCDAFGTGYFYIPGTETCLKIGGYVRFEVSWNSEDTYGGDNWDAYTRGRIEVTAKSDTELGELTSYIAMQAETSEYPAATGATDDAFYFDEVYLQLGGFKAGTYLNWWDANDLPGELDALGSNRVTAIAYIYEGDAWTAGIQLDELTGEEYLGTFTGDDPDLGGGQSVGLEAVVQGTFGPISAELLGSYDFANDDGAVRVIASANLGPGTFYLAGVYSSGYNFYYGGAEWTLATAYAFNATEKLQIIPEFQYFWNTAIDAEGDFSGPDYWTAGATVNYAITDGLASKVSVAYDDSSEAWGGIVRLQRNF